MGLVNALAATTQAEYEDYESYGDGDDMDVRMTANIISYRHLLATTPINLIGLDALTVAPAPLGIDSSITELDKAVVDGYSEIANLDELYDRSKAFLVDNYEGETETILEGGGNTIDARDLDIVFDGTAANVFDFDGSTITVRGNLLNCSTSNFTQLVTTGSVSFINGANPGTCIFRDSTGANGILTLTGLLDASVLVFDDASAGNDTISFQTNLTGSVSIPFAATSSTDYRVVVRKPGFSEVNFSFDPSGGGFFEFPISQFRSLTITGTPIYQDSGDVSRITVDFPNLRVNVGDFTIPAQELYDTLQDIEVTELGMKFPRISNFDGDSQMLLLNGYQFRNRDGATTVPGVSAFVFAETGGILDSSNGSVQFLINDTATVDLQEQIIRMLEELQGSLWDNTVEEYAEVDVNLVNIAGPGFDPLTDGLSNVVQSMLDRGIVDVNTLKDLVE